MGHRRSPHYRTRVTYTETWPGWAQGSSHDPLQIHNLLRWEIQHSDYATTTNGNHHATDAYKQLLYHQESQEKSKRWAQDEQTGSSQVQATGTQWFGGNDELGERSQQISAMEGAVGPRCVSQQGAFLAKPGQSKKTVVAHENYWGKQMQRA